jgi:hypothetical protein
VAETVVVVLLVTAAASSVVLEGGVYFDSCGWISVVKCFALVDGEEAVNFLDKSMGRARRGTIKRRPRKSTIACNFVVFSQTDNCLAGAMKLKSVIMNHPPVIQKGSISMNH